jgi:hypothetical protein
MVNGEMAVVRICFLFDISVGWHEWPESVMNESPETVLTVFILIDRV